MTPKYEKKRADEEAKERNRPFVVGKGPNAQLPYMEDDNKELEYLQYKVDGAIAKTHEAQNNVTSRQSQLSSVRSDIEGYCQG